MNLGEPVTSHVRRDAVALRASATVRESLLAAGPMVLALADVAALLLYVSLGLRLLG